MITPAQRQLAHDDIAAATERDGLKSVLRRLAGSIVGYVFASAVLAVWRDFDADDVNELASDLSTIEDVLRVGAAKLRGMP